MTGFCIGATEQQANTEEFAATLQKVMDMSTSYTNKEIDGIAKTVNVSQGCAADVFYLRTRSRHTQELEDELIRLHNAGTPPNMCDFGVTEKTQAALMKQIDDRIYGIYRDSEREVSPDMANGDIRTSA